LWDERDCNDDVDDDASGELQPDSDIEGEDTIEGLTQADAMRLGRVLRALAAAGLIDEWRVLVRGIDGQTTETRVVAMTYEPTHTARSSAGHVNR
jgi:hypothetical protein